jgi:hypothetical protein
MNSSHVFTPKSGRLKNDLTHSLMVKSPRTRNLPTSPSQPENEESAIQHSFTVVKKTPTKKKIVKRKKEPEFESQQQNISSSFYGIELEELIPGRKKKEIQKRRGIEESLVHTAMLDVQDANRIKAQFANVSQR